MISMKFLGYPLIGWSIVRAVLHHIIHFPKNINYTFGTWDGKICVGFHANIQILESLDIFRKINEWNENLQRVQWIDDSSETTVLRKPTNNPPQHIFELWMWLKCQYFVNTCWMKHTNALNRDFFLRLASSIGVFSHVIQIFSVRLHYGRCFCLQTFFLLKYYRFFSKFHFLFCLFSVWTSKKNRKKYIFRILISR